MYTPASNPSTETPMLIGSGRNRKSMQEKNGAGKDAEQREQRLGDSGPLGAQASPVRYYFSGDIPPNLTTSILLYCHKRKTRTVRERVVQKRFVEKQAASKKKNGRGRMIKKKCAIPCARHMGPELTEELLKQSLAKTAQGWEPFPTDPNLGVFDLPKVIECHPIVSRHSSNNAGWLTRPRPIVRRRLEWEFTAAMGEERVIVLKCKWIYNGRSRQ